MRLTIPKLRTWHLLGIVAASAVLFSVMQFRWSVEDPGYDLVRRLRSLNAAERAKAAGALGGYRPRERRAIVPLYELISDPDPGVRMAAAWTLPIIIDPKDKEEVGRARTVLTPALDDRDRGVRRAVALGLVGFGAEPKAVVPALIEVAGEGDAQARAEVVMALETYTRRDESARAVVLAAIRDADWAVRMRAAYALGDCATRPDLAPRPLLETITAALEAAADDPSPYVRAAVVSSLGGIGDKASVEIPRIFKALGDSDAHVRLWALNSLPIGRRGRRRSAAAIEALGPVLADRDAQVRAKAAGVLGWLGLDAEPQLPALRSLANDPDANVRQAVADAIAGIEKAVRDDRASFAKPIKELGDADPDVRALAADWLAGAGARSVDAVPALVRCLADREADVRRASAEALGKIGPAAVVALPELTRLAESDPDERVRLAATSARSILARGEGGNRAP